MSSLNKLKSSIVEMINDDSWLYDKIVDFNKHQLMNSRDIINEDLNDAVITCPGDNIDINKNDLFKYFIDTFKGYHDSALMEWCVLPNYFWKRKCKYSHFIYRGIAVDRANEIRERLYNILMEVGYTISDFQLHDFDISSIVSKYDVEKCMTGYAKRNITLYNCDDMVKKIMCLVNLAADRDEISNILKYYFGDDFASIKSDNGSCFFKPHEMKLT